MKWRRGDWYYTCAVCRKVLLVGQGHQCKGKGKQ